ncbi:kinase-like domain-containing protein [Crepidotus variabilis]|uniref:non-specific serine/threonine protein kinase n=1 Tax=Crepidotus variabilis TaxID=179855 RepID=A0A9P6ESQ8_9AGAR|nr:kinase-like domain-containing protein [Crepidotus variabilis]
MAPKQPCAKYQYVVTASGPKILPVDEPASKDEESPADYNAGGYLPVKVNDTFSNNRYQVVRKLGWGHFSTVWLVKDDLTHRHSALKVVKSAGRYAETARDEIKLLSRVSSVSPSHPGREHIVSFLDSFSHQAPESSHVCIVFEPLGENLLALIERHKKKGVPRPLVRVIAKQILLGLEYLHDECDLVHTDIKPENILISIPDIEQHIQNELSLSPSPTSRRVGVPLPAKTRAGVSIPQNPQRTRRQVQIFNSQPLSSPRSSTNLSMHARLDNISSGSVSSSYIAQMQMSRMSSTYGGSPGSSVPKVPSSLSSSVPKDGQTFEKQSVSQVFAAKGITAVPPRIVNSPSTSSSSSSISSVMASTTAGSSSLNSTPPTSLSHSLGNVMEFLGTGPFESELRTGAKISPPAAKPANEDERIGLLIPPKKQHSKSSLEKELSSAMSSSWKNKVSGSYTSQNSNTSTGKSSKSRPQGQGHDRSLVGSSFWKDPGTAAPAPAVLVSAVVGADGREGDFSKMSTVEDKGTTPSESSSATATIARPSPSGTPLPIVSRASTSLSDGGSRLAISEASSSASTVHDPCDTTTLSAHTNPPQQPSLLSQTAPRTLSPSKRTVVRISPPQQVSQLSAHMHRNKPPLNCACLDASHHHTSHPRSNTKSRSARLAEHPVINPATISSTSVTFTPASPTPAPPPTPIDSPTLSSLIPHALNSNTSTNDSKPSELPNLPPLETPGVDDSALPPPISIKIADLGNATPSKKHFTEDIQTRQYRAPEAILGRRDWDARADIWSVACVIFELLTAEYLFDPQGQGELFTKDDDHMAQIIELLGDFPLEVKMGGKYSRELFDHTGALRYIKTLKPWPLRRVMVEKYLYSEADASILCGFLEPMLTLDMRARVNARDLKGNKWLELTPDDANVIEW